MIYELLDFEGFYLMQLYNEQTEHTASNSHVYLDGNKLFQFTELYRDVANQNQMAVIIEDLIISKGFVMESDRNGEMKLVKPTEPETEYLIWTQNDNMGISKRVRKFVGEVNL